MLDRVILHITSRFILHTKILLTFYSFKNRGFFTILSIIYYLDLEHLQCTILLYQLLFWPASTPQFLQISLFHWLRLQSKAPILGFVICPLMPLTSTNGYLEKKFSLLNPPETPTQKYDTTLDLAFCSHFGATCTIRADLHTTSDHETLISIIPRTDFNIGR